ncbi:MAG: glycerol kinase, partial [Rhodococcus sp. (in: high G+C Gram-positive bacteria)]
MVDVLESIDAAALRRWAYRCVDSLTARCDEINALNVFPIPDSDTGTNLMFTFRAAVESMRAAGPT